MTLVETVTVGSGGAASIEFTNIPQTGKDLLVLCSLRTTAGSGFFGPDVKLNSTSFTNARSIQGDGSAAASYAGAAISIPGTNITANTFNSMAFYISNYTSSAAKSGSLDTIAENNSTNARQEINALLWSTVTTAVTSFTIDSAGTLAQYSSVSLYLVS